MARRLWQNDAGFGMIMMVVVAASVYVWVSGYGPQASMPAKSLAFSSAGALEDGVKTYTVVAATSGMTYDDVLIAVGGAPFPWTIDGVCGEGPTEDRTALICLNGSPAFSSSPLAAGSTIALRGVESGDTLRALDVHSNSVILTLTIG